MRANNNKKKCVAGRSRAGQSRITPSRLARERAGLSLEEAAKRAHCSVAYLRRLELHGGMPFIFAMKLAQIYNVSCQVFLYR